MSFDRSVLCVMLINPAPNFSSDGFRMKSAFILMSELRQPMNRLGGYLGAGFAGQSHISRK
jgi:hypothetical protein